MWFLQVMEIYVHCIKILRGSSAFWFVSRLIPLSKVFFSSLSNVCWWWQYSFSVPGEIQKNKHYKKISIGLKLSLIKNPDACVLFPWTNFSERDFLCVLRLFLRNSLRGTRSGLTAANGICMEAASPTNNSTEGSQPSSFLIPLGRNSHPLFPASCLPPLVSVSCLGCFYCRHAGSFAGAQPPLPFCPVLSLMEISVTPKVLTTDSTDSSEIPTSSFHQS